MNMLYIALIILLIALPIGVWLGWRLVSQRRSLPCPTSLAGLLDNPFTEGYHARVVSRLELSPGLHVLDAGCGPGLLSTAIASAVAPHGRVLALDIQPGMIAKARARAMEAEISNIDFLVARLGDGQLLAMQFDRALLVTVLGEIPDKIAALREVRTSLRPGGFLSITEVLPDPHYQSIRKITVLAEAAGLRLRNKYGNAFMFTVNLERALGA
jgi:ubiquinone/menaquinone biosynthesis C-methylase UbiE